MTYFELQAVMSGERNRSFAFLAELKNFFPVYLDNFISKQKGIPGLLSYAFCGQWTGDNAVGKRLRGTAAGTDFCESFYAQTSKSHTFSFG